MGLVTVEAAQALRDTFGYPQDTDTHHYFFLKGSDVWQESCTLDEFGPIVAAEWLFRPDDITALNWLEEHHGFHWFRTPGEWHYTLPDSPPDLSESWDSRSTPSALILAIAAYLKQHPAPAGAEGGR